MPRFLWFVVVAVLMAGCTGEPGPTLGEIASLSAQATAQAPWRDLTQVPLSSSAVELAARGQGQLRAVKHEFFPLEGQHATAACLSCHQNNQFVGLPETCEGCHEQDRPPEHFAGSCAGCHTPVAWDQVRAFDHALAGASDCQACHLPDRPAGHFEGQCSQCHTTRAWQPAFFDHAAAGATDCLACHTQDKPANHFQGQCSNCHTTTAWQPAFFDHAAAGATDCLACHAQDKPANHFQGQCSNCHTTTSWSGATFAHNIFPITHGGAGGECTACHTTGNPPDYTCTQCHSWASLRSEHNEEGIFNFANNCMACHAGGSDGEGYEGREDYDDDAHDDGYREREDDDDDDD